MAKVTGQPLVQQFRSVLETDNQELMYSETWILTHFPQRYEPEQIATKAPRHKAKPLVNIHLCVFVSWWRRCFAIKCKEFTTKTQNGYLRGFLEQPRLGLQTFTRMEASAFVKKKKFWGVAIIHWIFKGLIQSLRAGYKQARAWRFLQELDLIWGLLDFSR
jgi:hypothetical protein